jgi:outer membrane protein assembly factor BamB
MIMQARSLSLVCIVLLLLLSNIGILPITGSEILASNSNLEISDLNQGKHLPLEQTSSSNYNLVVKWKYNASGEILFPPVFGKDGTIYIVSEPFYTLHAIDSSGALKWKYEVEYKVRFAPVVGEDGTVYLCVEDPKRYEYLYAINNGILKWKIKAEIEIVEEGLFTTSKKIVPGKIDSPPIMDEQGTIYFMATSKTLWHPRKAIFVVNNDGTLRIKISDHEIEKWGDIWEYGIDKFGDLIITIDPTRTHRARAIELITARNGIAYITAVALKKGIHFGDDVIVAVGPDGKVKWVSELFTLYRRWQHVVVGRDAMYLVIMDHISGNVYLQALGYDGRVRYEFRADDYWNEEFYKEHDSAEIEPVIDKEDTIYLIFSNWQYGDFSIIYAISSDGTLKWKSKLPFHIIGESLKEYHVFYVDLTGRLYLTYRPTQQDCLYVINPNGELVWKYEYHTMGPRTPLLVRGDGIIYLFTRDMKFIPKGMISRSITFDIIYILSPEGELIKSSNVYDLMGIPAEVDAQLWEPVLSPDGTILAFLYMEGMKRVEILVAIGPLPLKKTMITINVNPSKIVEKMIETVTVTGRLMDESGNGLGGRVINIYRDGNVVVSCTTDSNGYYNCEWRDVYLEKGSYQITAKFEGDPTYAASSASTILTVTPGILALSLSEGWQSKELFVPVYMRSHDDSNRFIIGVHNKRDMWYIVKVFKRVDGKVWEEVHPWKYPYLPPYGELAFPYTPNEGEEVKIEVWNDPNDKILYALVFMDFMMRSCLGTPLPLRSTGENGLELRVSDPKEFISDLIALFDGFKGAIGYLATKQWKKALEKVGDILSSEAMRNLVKKLVIEVGVEEAKAAPEKIAETAITVSKAAGVVLHFVKNIGLWIDFLENIGKGPFMEEVIFTVKKTGPPTTPNLVITEGLKITPDGPYYSGQTITAIFTITNRGGEAINIHTLTLSSRGPDGGLSYFTHKLNIMLKPGDSYNYKGELILQSHGPYQFSVEYQTSDGQWVTRIPAEARCSDTININVNPVPDKFIYVGLGSPAELRVYDSHGRVTGLVNGKEKEEIPHSLYFEGVVLIFLPADTYRYQVVGTAEGIYNLTIVNVVGDESNTFDAIEVPISTGAVHQYNIDWDKLSKGEKGATVEVDSDGDGVFEWSLSSGREITSSMLKPPSKTTFQTETQPQPAPPSWITLTPWILVVVAVILAVLATSRAWHPKR